MGFAVRGPQSQSLSARSSFERVKAGLRNAARAKGRRLGRPRVSVSAAKIQELRAEGLTLDIAKRCRVSKTTVIRTLKEQLPRYF